MLEEDLRLEVPTGLKNQGKKDVLVSVPDYRKRKHFCCSEETKPSRGLEVACRLAGTAGGQGLGIGGQEGSQRAARTHLVPIKAEPQSQAAEMPWPPPPHQLYPCLPPAACPQPPLNSGRGFCCPCHTSVTLPGS